MGHLGPEDIFICKSRIQAPIFTSKTSFSSESWGKSSKIMKPQKMYWPWNLGPRNYIWATWVQKTYPTIGTEPWLQYWQTTPHCKSIMAAQKWQLNLLAEFLLHIFECLLTQNPTNQGSQLSRFFHNIWTTIRKSNRKGSYGIIFAGKWF